MFIPEPQYIEGLKEGDFVTVEKQRHKIIFNGKPHIQYRENGKRVRRYLQDMLFEYGTMADYVFNEWWMVYDYETFESFAKSEMEWIINN